MSRWRVELFDWTYRRSITKYKAILESMGSAGSFTSQVPRTLGECDAEVVQRGSTLNDALATLAIPEAESTRIFRTSRNGTCESWPFNCARYRLSIRKTRLGCQGKARIGWLLISNEARSPGKPAAEGLQQEQWPRFTRPSRIPVSSAKGTDAAELLPA